MSQIEVRQCDVSKSTKNVKRYRFKIDEVCGPEEDEFNMMKCDYIDLSPSSYKRAIKFLARGLSPTSYAQKDFDLDNPECFNAPNENLGIDSGMTTGQEVEAPTG